MAFGKEMKEFVSAFKVGSSIADKWNDNERKATKDAKAQEDEIALKKAQDEAEANVGKRHTTSTNTPGSNYSALNVSGGDAGDSTETERRFMDTVKTGVTNPFGLAAVAATGRAESSWKPTAVNDSWNDPSESGVPGRSGGALSWRDGRYAAMLKHASESGEGLGSIRPETQASFFLKENPSLIEKLNNAKSLDEAMSAMNNAWAFAGYNQPGHHEPARRRGYAEQYYRRYGQQAALPTEGTPTVYAASGGLIEDPREANIPGLDQTEADYSNTNDARMPRYTPGSEGGALPVTDTPKADEKVKTAADTSNEPGAGVRAPLDPDLRNEAIDAGMKQIASLFSGKGAIADADPDRRANVEAFARHSDTATAQDMREADQAIDPKGELAPHLRSMARLNAAYDFWTKKGDPVKAAKVAASMMDYSRKVAMSGGATIQALIEKGNLAGAAKTAERVYDEMPNGNKLEMKPTKDGRAVEYKVFDPDGKPTDGGRLAINEFMRMATGLQDGTLWFQTMGYYGGLSKTQQGGGKGNRLTQAGNRPAAAPRTTAAERNAAAEAAAEGAAAQGRQNAAAGAIGALNAPVDLTPSTSNAPMNAGALPVELGAVGGVPNSGAMVQPSEFSADNGGVAPQGGNPSIPYNAGTGISRVLPAEAQSPPGVEERAAGEMSTAGERQSKKRQVADAAVREEALARAEKAYRERANRKGVRTSDSTKSRAEAMELVQQGFMGGAVDKDGEAVKIPGDKRVIISGLASKIMRGNDIDPESAGRILKDIFEKGPALKSDGSVGPRGSQEGVFLDAAGIRQLMAAYGGKAAPGVKDIDTSLTARNYKMPSDEAKRRDYSDATIAKAGNANWSRNAQKAGAALGAIMGAEMQRNKNN